MFRNKTTKEKNCLKTVAESCRRMVKPKEQMREEERLNAQILENLSKIILKDNSAPK